MVNDEWYLLPPMHFALDDLRGPERNCAIYADSFDDKVHHICTNVSREHAELIIKAVAEYRERHKDD